MLLGSVAVVVVACTAPPPAVDGRTAGSTDTIAFLFDGSTDDADLVTGPALAGLELSAEEAGGLDVEPLNVGGSPAEVLSALRELGDRPGVVAAVVAPWTAPPEGAEEALAARGVPVVSLSWGWEPSPEHAGPEHSGMWISLAADPSTDATALARTAIGSSGPEGPCAAGDPDPMSGVLIDAVTRIGSSGDPVRPVGTVDPMRAATAEAVAARISRMRCSTLLWTGGADGAASLLARVAATPALVVTSRLKTDDGLALAGEGGPVSTVCVCADVTLTSSPQLQRFVHDVQASSGSAPGPFGLEAYDAGRLLLEQLRLANGSRAGLVERLATLEDFTGLGGRYLPVSGATSTFVAAPPGIWHAAGSRWLPDAPPPS